MLYIFVPRQNLVGIHTEIPFMKNITSIDFYPHIAVLVEFRRLDHIITIVHNVNNHIPSTWPIQIFHGKENEDFIKNSTLAPLIASEKIFLCLMEEVYGKRRTNRLRAGNARGRPRHGRRSRWTKRRRRLLTSGHESSWGSLSGLFVCASIARRAAFHQRQRPLREFHTAKRPVFWDRALASEMRDGFRPR